MKNYIHATIVSTLAWAGNIYDLLLLTFVYSFFEKVYGLNYFDFSILFALGLIGRAIGGTYFGRLADKIGRKPILAIGTAGYSVFQIILAFSPNSLILFVARFLQGIFMGAQWTAGTVLAYENAPANLRGIVTGIVQAGYGIGYALTGLTYIILENEPRLFLITGALPLILLPYIKIINETKFSSFTFKPRYNDYLSLLIKATAGMSGMFLAYFSVFGNYTLVAEKYLNMNSITLGLLITLSNLGLAASFILFGRLADKVDKRKLIYIGVSGLLVSLPLAVPIFIKSIIISEIGILIYAFSTGFWPLMPLLLAEAVPTEVRGMLSGLSYNIGGFVGGIGNIILGIIEIELGLRALIDTINFFGFFALALVLVSVITWPKSKSPTIIYSD
ncbi:MFS transporter [Sulfurisphaera ohwakuensis]|uniref:MFS transporter n=1 Tax=Sulfurisphaera ohwakuensis TaxID=69656 RepID=A0A650CJN7_SULOH|nr:MFS transporter [Sulfurisphaera ohwakuensis]MBB5254661.1 SHS family lactate transporter-like MFS transporter [Sulfurisphaera ohwakuensis]QGR18050.1 MFS transporter [Sulfurisphaera ohwakuensis]